MRFLIFELRDDQFVLSFVKVLYKNYARKLSEMGLKGKGEKSKQEHVSQDSSPSSYPSPF